MATTRADIWGRLNSICVADPFRFVQAQSPFDFKAQPSGQIDGVFRITWKEDAVIGGMSFTEDRTDVFEIWVARTQNSAPQDAYEALTNDVTSLTAAIARYGATTWGEFNLVDGGSAEVEHLDGASYAVARVALPLNYESTL